MYKMLVVTHWRTYDDVMGWWRGDGAAAAARDAMHQGVARAAVHRVARVLYSASRRVASRRVVYVYVCFYLAKW